MNVIPNVTYQAQTSPVTHLRGLTGSNNSFSSTHYNNTNNNTNNNNNNSLNNNSSNNSYYGTCSNGYTDGNNGTSTDWSNNNISSNNHRDNIRQTYDVPQSLVTRLGQGAGAGITDNNRQQIFGEQESSFTNQLQFKYPYQYNTQTASLPGAQSPRLGLNMSNTGNDNEYEYSTIRRSQLRNVSLNGVKLVNNINNGNINNGNNNIINGSSGGGRDAYYEDEDAQRETHLYIQDLQRQLIYLNLANIPSPSSDASTAAATANVGGHSYRK
jgi:hypothetical protein